MMMRRIFPQPDLLELHRRGWFWLRGADKVIGELRVLLMEAMATPHAAGGTQGQWEAGDDEDHA